MVELSFEQAVILQERLEKESLESLLQELPEVSIYILTSWDSKTDEVSVYDAYFDLIKAANRLSLVSSLRKNRYIMTVETNSRELENVSYGFSSQKISEEDLEYVYSCLEASLNEELLIEIE